MKLLSLKLRGIGRFRDEVSLPVEQLNGDRVVAIAGRNGAGKSTIIESILGALWGDMPSRGTVARMAHARDSFVELGVETDQRYTIRRAINAVLKTPKTEVYLFGPAGEPLSDGKAGTFESEISKRFPSEAIFLASGFSAQRREGQFLEISKADRKSLFAEMLGLGHLQALADAAGARAAGAEAELVKHRARAEALTAQAAQRDRLADEVRGSEGAHAMAVAAREDAERRAGETRAAVDAWRERAAELQQAVTSARAAVDAATKQHAHLAEKLAGEQQRLAKLSAQRAGLEGRLQQRAALEREATVVDAEDLAAAEAELVVVRAAHQAASEAVLAWERRHAAAQQAVSKAEAGHRAAVQSAEADARHAEHEVETLGRQAAGLHAMPCKGEGIYAVCPLIVSATRARDTLADAEAARATARAAAVRVKADHAAETAAHAALAALGPRPEDPSLAEVRKLEAQATAARAAAQRIADARAKLQALADVQRQADALDVEASEIRERITAGRDVVADAATEVQAARAGATSAEQAAIAIGERPAEVDEHLLGELRRAETAAAAGIARARQALETAEAAAEQLATARTVIAAASTDVDDWRTLQKDLGRDGVQSLEVDAAGPEVSGLINDLLHSCYGSRFSVALETTQLKADGSGTKEIFDLRVIDSEMGTDGSASDLSGGERVIVAEALGLAIAIYNARKSAIPIMDVFRDETAGALDAEKAPLYVTMLRKAVEVGNLHRVFFIAHNPALWALADSTIVVEDGTARVAAGGAV